MTVLTLEKKPSVALFAPAARVAKSPLKVPAWAVLTVLALATLLGFAAGRQKPAHHYVSYFGYPMVLDTTTGKACYAIKPTTPAQGPVQPASYALDGSQPDGGAEMPNGVAVPVCGQD